MLGEDVLYLPVDELGQRIKAGKLSPVELTEAYLKRSAKIGAPLNAPFSGTQCVAYEYIVRHSKPSRRSGEQPTVIQDRMGIALSRFPHRGHTCSLTFKSSTLKEVSENIEAFLYSSNGSTFRRMM